MCVCTVTVGARVRCGAVRHGSSGARGAHSGEVADVDARQRQGVTARVRRVTVWMGRRRAMTRAEAPSSPEFVGIRFADD